MGRAVLQLIDPIAWKRYEASAFGSKASQVHPTRREWHILWAEPKYAYRCRCPACELTSLTERSTFERLPPRRETIRRVIWGFVHRFERGEIRSFHTSPCHPCRGNSDFLDYYRTSRPNKRAPRLRDVERCVNPRPSRSYKAFVKREILPTPDYTSPDSLPCPKQGRTIHAIRSEANYAVGAGLGAFEEYFYSCINTTKGLSITESAQLFYRTYQAGDYIVVTDVSGFDHCVGQFLRESCVRALKHLCPQLRDAAFDYEHAIGYYWHYVDTGSVHSGERCTGIFAVIIMCACCEYCGVRYINCGDDNIAFGDRDRLHRVIEVMRQIGLDARIEGETRDPSSIKFLQHYYVLGSTGIPTAVYDPIRFLARIAVCPVDPTTPQGAGWLYAKCEAQWIQYGHIPVVRDVLRGILRALRHRGFDNRVKYEPDSEGYYTPTTVRLGQPWDQTRPTTASIYPRDPAVDAWFYNQFSYHGPIGEKLVSLVEIAVLNGLQSIKDSSWPTLPVDSNAGAYHLAF